jgi:hypothetical protein
MIYRLLVTPRCRKCCDSGGMTTHTLALPLGGPNLAIGLKRRVYQRSARTVWILVTTPVAAMNG